MDGFFFLAAWLNCASQHVKVHLAPSENVFDGEKNWGHPAAGEPRSQNVSAKDEMARVVVQSRSCEALERLA